MQRSAPATLTVVTFAAVLAIALMAPVGGDSFNVEEAEAGGGEGQGLTTTTTAPSAYEYSVLAGIQPKPRADGSPDGFQDLTVTCGWHVACVSPYTPGYGIDIRAGSEVPVYAAIRAAGVRSTVEARVSLVTDDDYIIDDNPRFGASGSSTTGSCRRAEFIISDPTRPSSGKPNRFQYVHVVGSVERDAQLTMPTMPGTTKLTALGTVSADPWVEAGGGVLTAARNHTWATKRHFFRIGNATDGYKVYRVWRYVTERGVRYRSQPVFESASPAAVRQARAEPPLEQHGDRKFARVGGNIVRLLRYHVDPGNPSSAVEYYQQAIDSKDDFPDCIIDGSHLHQHGDRDSSTHIYGNKAFPDAPGGASFCSSVWMFKVQSSHSPEAQPPSTVLGETCTARAAKTYTLTTSASGGGSISPSGVTSHKADGVATVTATWNTATHDFVSWSGPCKDFSVPATSPATCVVSTDANKVVSATFKPGPKHTLTTSVAPQPDAGRVDPPSGDHQYAVGSRVTLTATGATSPERDWTFLRWEFRNASGERVTKDGVGQPGPGEPRPPVVIPVYTNNPIDVTLNIDMTATAVFALVLCVPGDPTIVPCDVDESPTFAVQSFKADFTVGSPGIVSLPAASGGNGPLRYTLARQSGIAGAAATQGAAGAAEGLPDGLAFDPATHRLIGTPKAAMSATTFTLTAADSDTNDAAADSATITVTIAVNPRTVTPPRPPQGPPLRIRPLSDSAVIEGQPAFFVVESSESGTSLLTVGLRVTESGRILGSARPTSVMTLSPTVVVALVRVDTVDDSTEEPNSTVTVRLVGGTGYRLGSPSSATMVVVDNDGEPLVTVAASSEKVTEGQPAKFTVTRTGSTTSPLDVTMDVFEAGDVIREPAPSSVRIPPGSASATLTVDTEDDAVDEEDGVVVAQVELVDAGATYVPGTARAALVAVKDNDPAMLSVRVSARVHADGRVEVGLRQLGADGTWGPRLLPRQRFLTADAAVGSWKWTTPVTVSSHGTGHSTELRITARRLANGRVEFGLRQLGTDGAWGPRLLPTSRILNTASAAAGTWYRVTSPFTVTAKSSGAVRGAVSGAEGGGGADANMQNDPDQTPGGAPPASAGLIELEPDRDAPRSAAATAGADLSAVTRATLDAGKAVLASCVAGTPADTRPCLEAYAEARAVAVAAEAVLASCAAAHPADPRLCLRVYTETLDALRARRAGVPPTEGP